MAFWVVDGFMGGDGNVVAELAKSSCQSAGAVLAELGIRFAALLDISHPLMQNLPNQEAEPMCDCPDGRLVSQARQRTPEHRLFVKVHADVLAVIHSMRVLLSVECRINPRTYFKAAPFQ